MSTNAFHAKLETLAATPSKKSKLAIVQTFTEFEQNLAKRALDPTVTYGVAKLDQPARSGTDEWSDAEFKLLDDLASRKLTGNAALQQISFSLAELTPESSEVLRRVLLKDLRCGTGVTLVNTAFPGLVPEFPYMRCTLPAKSNILKWDWSHGVFSQLKADGMFANVTVYADGRLQITSRQGSAFPPGALGHLEDAILGGLRRSTQTHGELTVYREGKTLSREVGNGVLNALAQGGPLEDGTDVMFEAWDQIPLDQVRAKGSYEVPYATRWTDLLGQLNSRQLDSWLLQPIDTRVVHCRAEADSHYREMLAKKKEGTVLKYGDAIWRDGDSMDQVKFKLEVDVDLEIKGFNPGEAGKRTEHTFGSLLCKTLDGLLEVGVSGLTREVEQDLWDRRDEMIGRVVCVKANGVMAPTGEAKIHSLFLPRFVELRDDKFRADSLQEVMDQFENATK